MLFDPLAARLRLLLRARALPRDAERQSALAARLEARFEARRPAPNRPGLTLGWTWPLAARIVAVGLGLSAATVAACQVRVDFEMELGRRFVFDFPPGAIDDGGLEAMVEALEGCCGIETMELRVDSEASEGSEASQAATATMDLWGTDLDIAALETVITRHGVAMDRVEALALEGPVRTTLGARLRHDLLDLELDPEVVSVERARKEILERIEREGFAAEAEVWVEDSASGRRIEVRLQQTERHVDDDLP